MPKTPPVNGGVSYFPVGCRTPSHVAYWTGLRARVPDIENHAHFPTLGEVTMPTFPDLAQRISYAHKQLQVARQDGDAVSQLFWSGERDHLLDEYIARAKR